MCLHHWANHIHLIAGCYTGQIAFGANFLFHFPLLEEFGKLSSSPHVFNNINSKYGYGEQNDVVT